MNKIRKKKIRNQKNVILIGELTWVYWNITVVLKVKVNLKILNKLKYIIV